MGQRDVRFRPNSPQNHRVSMIYQDLGPNSLLVQNFEIAMKYRDLGPHFPRNLRILNEMPRFGAEVSAESWNLNEKARFGAASSTES